jgi:hypothetical protein
VCVCVIDTYFTEQVLLHDPDPRTRYVYRIQRSPALLLSTVLSEAELSFSAS